MKKKLTEPQGPVVYHRDNLHVIGIAYLVGELQLKHGSIYFTHTSPMIQELYPGEINHFNVSFICVQ